MLAFIFLNGTLWHSCKIDEKTLESSKAGWVDLALADMYSKIGGEPEDIDFYLDEEGRFVVERRKEDGKEGETKLFFPKDQFEVLDVYDIFKLFFKGENDYLEQVFLDINDSDIIFDELKTFF